MNNLESLQFKLTSINDGLDSLKTDLLTQCEELIALQTRARENTESIKEIRKAVEQIIKELNEAIN